jgi:Undecaprenyl-phosphate glucose phosphotransferase
LVNRQKRLLVVYHVIFDGLLGMLAFALAYAVRFETGLIPAPKGQPPFDQYVALLPLVGLLAPLVFNLQGAYRLRRNRTRVDDFFSVLVGTCLTVVVGLLATLTFQVYYADATARAQGLYEVSQIVWGLFILFNVSLTYASREAVRFEIQRRFRAGIGLKRVLIAGSGDLARHVADRLLQHAEFGYQVVGFVDDSAGSDTLGYRGLPLLGSLGDAEEVVQRESIDQLYVALPLEEHVSMLKLIEVANRECIDIKVVPDLLQFIALRARLEDLDGVPIININDIPLQGLHGIIKRAVDLTVSLAALAVLAIPFALIAAAIRLTSPGPIFYRQERMGLDRRPFMVLKFRSMNEDAEADTGPVWTREDDPRRTAVGGFLRRSNLDELPQLLNVLRGEMSLVGPRPERPFFVEQFKQRVPQYMLRHKVKSGMTGWAQVNGWRGNTSIEKRIEYDLYYIENWSVGLDFKILWLTLVRGFFHRHAY